LDRHSDTDLVGAVRQGDRSAYAELVRRHYGKVFVVCFAVLGNVHDAEDVAQDAMIAGLQKLRQLRDGGQFGPWIAQIARNLSINLVRKKTAAERALNRKAAPPVGCQRVMSWSVACRGGRARSRSARTASSSRWPRWKYFIAWNRSFGRCW